MVHWQNSTNTSNTNGGYGTCCPKSSWAVGWYDPGLANVIRLPFDAESNNGNLICLFSPLSWSTSPCPSHIWFCQPCVLCVLLDSLATSGLDFYWYLISVSFHSSTLPALLLSWYSVATRLLKIRLSSWFPILEHYHWYLWTLYASDLSDYGVMIVLVKQGCGTSRTRGTVQVRRQ